MAQPLHDRHAHGHTASPTVVEDRDAGPVTAIVVILVAAVLGFLIWLFAFSGVVFDNGGGTDTVNIEENQTTNDTGDAGGGATTDDTGTTSSP